MIDSPKLFVRFLTGCMEDVRDGSLDVRRANAIANLGGKVIGAQNVNLKIRAAQERFTASDDLNLFSE